TLRVTLGDEIEGAEPYEVKASSTVLNGGREETCLASAGNAPCAYPPRRRQPALLSLVDARLSGVVPPPPRTDAALSSLEDPSGLDAGVLGRSDGARRHRHVWDRADPPHPRGPEPPADRPQRRVESSLDCRRQTLSAVKPIWPGGRVGL